MDRGVHIVADKAFAHDDGILVVISVPGHEGDGHVLTQRQLTVFHGRSIRQDIALFHTLVLLDDRALVDGRSGVRALELAHAVFMRLSRIIAHDDTLRIHIFDDAVFLGDDADARVFGDLIFDACADIRGMRHEQRNGLTLHVGAHQGSGGVIVFQERHAGCRH